MGQVLSFRRPEDDPRSSFRDEGVVIPLRPEAVEKDEPVTDADRERLQYLHHRIIKLLEHHRRLTVFEHQSKKRHGCWMGVLLKDYRQYEADGDRLRLRDRSGGFFTLTGFDRRQGQEIEEILKHTPPGLQPSRSV